jgi:ATP-dependent helicase HrpB
MSVPYPIFEVIPEIKKKLIDHNLVILQAPPGAGKSTILPLHLIDESWLHGKKMMLLEPRKLAARSVAMRMAQLRNEQVGRTVGYRVRFENMVSVETKIEVITEGILSRMIQSDNLLEDVGLVIFDEFHERSLQADLALALCYQIQQVVRPDLKMLIMSATLNGEHLSSQFRAPIITSSGRQHPVTFNYIPNDDTPIASQVSRVIKKALRETTGDLLVFLPGVGEIKRVHTLLEEESIKVNIHPLYGDLSFKKQQEAILPDAAGNRKVVLATSIAETSLTIEGISVVIDSGLARVPRFDPRSGLTRLETIRVTKDAADQRAGRAGRLGPGQCYRLWSERTHHLLQSARKPEILEADLAPLMLDLHAFGESVQDLSWVTQPPTGSVQQANDLLVQLGAISEGKITVRGKEMASLPIHPRLSHMLLEAQNDFQQSVACDIAALLEERDPLTQNSSVDFILRVETLRKWRAGERIFADQNMLERIEKLARNWRAILKVKEQNSTPVDAAVGVLLLAAYPDRVAKQIAPHQERYKLANGRVVQLPPNDALAREPWLVVAQLDAGKNEGRIFSAAGINETDLEHFAIEQEVVRWDRDREAVVGFIEKRISNVILSSKPLSSISSEKRIKQLIQIIGDGGLKLLEWSDPVIELQARLLSLRKWRPDEPWPDVSNQYLLDTLEDWLPLFLESISTLQQLKRLDWYAIFMSLVPWDLSRRLNDLAPSKMEVPSGSLIQVHYFADGRQPEMAVRLQEVFGLLETPTVNQEQTKILLHLLSPGYKPVQVTQDLHSFWGSAYHEVRKELRGRYPKHSWPEDPWTAQAVRGVKKR